MSFASSETSMHVNAKQAAKNVKMLPETPNLYLDTKEQDRLV